MTSIIARSNPLFTRNSFPGDPAWGIPWIQKDNIELNHVDLIAYSDTRRKDTERNYQKGVHFFIDDYRFEGIYKNPKKSLEKLSKYAFLLTPDYSTYSNMPYWRQMESIAHSRWCGAYWQDQGMTVIPTISWSDQISYDFCFLGIEKHSIVAIGMIGCKRQKKNFMRGYDEMMNRIEPEAVICFGSPFPEMEGDVITVDYMKSRKVVR